MAMEIKTLNVANENEAFVIEFWSQFRWALKSSQRVYNKDSHLDHGWSVTETVDFTKLVFERDKNGPNYAKIKALEDEYFVIKGALPKKAPEMPVAPKGLESIEEWARNNNNYDIGGSTGCLGATIWGLIGLSAIIVGTFLHIFGFIVNLIAVIVGIFILAYAWEHYSSSTNAKNRELAEEALNNKNPEAKARLEEEYAKAKKTYDEESEPARKYLAAVNRLSDIIKELETLI